MKRITKLLIIASFFTLFSINILTANISQHAIKLNNQDEVSVEQLSEPIVSAEGDVTLNWKYGFPNILSKVAISGDGVYIMAINQTTATFFHRGSNSTIWRYNPGISITGGELADDGRYAVIVDSTENVTLIDRALKTDIWHFEDFVGSTFVYADISSLSNCIAIANSSGGIYLFDNSPSGGQKIPIWRFDELSGISYSCVAISGNGQYIVTGDAQGNITLFNTTATIPKTYEWQFNTTSTVENVAISYDGKYIVASNNQKEVYLFNTTDPQVNPIWNYTGAEDIKDIAIAKSPLSVFSGVHYVAVYEKWLFSYFNDSYQSGNKNAEWSYKVSNAGRIALSGTGQYPLLATWLEGSCYLFNNTKITPKIPIWKEPNEAYRSVDITVLGNYFIIASASNVLYLYHHDNLPTGLGPFLRGDDDDDDDDEPAIPLGNYYLGFAAIAIVALIVIMKRKALLKDKK